MQLNQIKLGGRLGAGFGLVLLLAALIAVMGWQRLLTTRDNLDTSERINLRARDALKWQGLTQLNVNRTLAIAKSGSHADVNGHFAPLIKQTSAEISDIQKTLQASSTTEEERQLFADIATKRQSYITSRDAIFTLLALDDPGAKDALTSQLLPAAERYIEAINRFQDMQQGLLEADSAATRSLISNGQTWMVSLGLLCIGLGVICAWVITRSVTQPLRDVMDVTDRIAAGDLTCAIKPQGKDEIAALLRSLSHMQASLLTIVSDVRLVTDSITTASSEVAAGSQDLSGRTEQAASALEQTASSMEQMSSTIRQTADSASSANQLADNAAKVAAEGGQVVTRVMSTMASISDSSKRIADIIGVIDGIAFQTNILALNAAVEAARAGEQGKGFSVVASEVRALAHRVAEAAKEVKQLISTSVTQVETGASLVKDAGSAMSDTVLAVQRVADIIGEISTASSEQSEGIRQVNEAVNHLDRMTQQNAALVEESTAAAHSLSEQSSRLAATVSVFKIQSSVD
jgi:methyl-accepting chemotaxis protein